MICYNYNITFKMELLNMDIHADLKTNLNSIKNQKRNFMNGFDMEKQQAIFQAEKLRIIDELKLAGYESNKSTTLNLFVANKIANRLRNENYEPFILPYVMMKQSSDDGDCFSIAYNIYKRKI